MAASKPFRILIVAGLAAAAALIFRGTPVQVAGNEAAGISGSAELPAVPGAARVIGSGPATNRSAPGATLRRVESRHGGVHVNLPSLAASFERDGVTVAPALDAGRRGRFRYSFAGLRVGSERLASGGPADPVLTQAGGDVVSFSRGWVEERYTIRERDLEQDFLIRELPAGRGEIVLEGTVSTSLEAPPSGTRGPRLAFGDRGSEALVLSEAVAVDARGRRLALDLAYEDGILALRVPADWVAEAALPILVDPIIGSPVQLRTGINEMMIDLAGNTANGGYVALWGEYLGATWYEISSQQLDAAGQPVGAPVLVGTDPVSGTATNELYPAIAYAPGADRFLAAWFSYPGSPGPNAVRARILDGTGLPVAAAFEIQSFTFLAGIQPRIVWDGVDRWLVGHTAPRVDQGRYVAAIGLHWVDLTGGVTVQAPPEIDSPNADYSLGDVIVARAGSTLAVAWIQYFPFSAPTHYFKVRTLDRSGAYLSAAEVVQDFPANTNVLSGPDLVGGEGKFLLLWGDLPGGVARARLASVDAAGSLSFDGPPFAAMSRIGPAPTDPMTYWGPSSPRGVFLPTRQAWLVTCLQQFSPGGVDLYAVQVGPTGAASDLEALTQDSDSESYAKPAWASGTEALVAYRAASPWAPGDVRAMVLRYQTQALSTEPPPAPADLTATRLDDGAVLSWTGSDLADGYLVLRSETSGGTFDDIGYVTGTSFIDTGLEYGVRYFYLVVAYNGAGGSEPSEEVSVRPRYVPLKVLLVTGAPAAELGPSDLALAARLDTLGYGVRVKRGGATVPEDAEGKALVLISSTAGSGAVEGVFAAAATPLMNCLPGALPSLGMTGAVRGTDFGSAGTRTALAILDPAHPLAAGLSGTPTTTSLPLPCTWGLPAPAAVRVAEPAGRPGKNAIFAYETGAPMVAGTAPARRVGFFAGNDVAASLTPEGWALFDAAVRWLTQPPAPPSAISVDVRATSVRLSWGAVEGALTYTLLRSGSPEGPFVVLASGLQGTTYLDTGLVTGETYYYRLVSAGATGISEGGTVVAATPRAGAVASGITGPRYLQVRPPEAGEFIATPFQYGTFQVHIKKEDAAGDLQDLAALGLTIQSFQWDIIGSAAKKFIEGPTECEVMAEKSEGYVMVGYLATLSDGSRVSELAALSVVKKPTIRVAIRFPENAAPARTTINPNFFSTDENTRLSARGRFAAGTFDGQPRGVYHYLRDAWRQAAIDFYMMTDMTLGDPGNTFPGEAFDAQGRCVTDVRIGRKNGLAPWLRKHCETRTRYRDAVAVYLVRELAPDPDGLVAAGVTAGTSDPYWNTIIVEDGVWLGQIGTLPPTDASRANTRRTYAHEMGHALGLPDITDIDYVVKGLNNNLQAVYPDEQALKYLMMLSMDGLNAVTGDLWLEERHSGAARFNAKNHPAFWFELP